MVKRQKVEEIAGVLEFAGRTKEDPEFVAWLAEHRAQNGGKLRVSQGGTGVRVAFSSAADLIRWQLREGRTHRGVVQPDTLTGPARRR